jgi:flagellar assembly protein FliH
MSLSRRIIKATEVRIVERSTAGSRHFVETRYGRTEPEKDAPPSSPSGLEKSLAAAEEKLRQVEKESYDRGFQAGAEHQRRELAPVAESLTRLIREVGGLKQRIFTSTEKETIRLVLAVAEKVIHREASLHADVIQHVLRDAIRNIIDREGMKIRLNPRDFLHIMEVKQDFLRSMDGLKNVIFEEDSGIPFGGAVIETSFGEVDARLEQQIGEIRIAMEAKLE